MEHVADEAVHKELGERLATPNEPSSQGTDSGGGPRFQEAIADNTAQTRFKSVSKISNDSLLAKGNTLQSDEDIMKLNKLMALCTTLQNRVLDLEKTKTTQRRIDVIDQDEDITLVNNQDDADRDMFDVNDLGGEEVFIAEQEVVKDVNENVVKEVVNAAQDSTATTTITTEELTFAQVLKALKTSKPKVKGIVIQEQEEPEPVKPKKKDQIMLDEEATKRLQAEFDEEERLARERAKKNKKPILL
uniref:Uncharacterized protein n=1 Tax=Tanacetum cinerariifolium TaxID=118510 RepID=A0A699GIC7_TANCI|nr:hypothetical protein [Tanacetum cinerariifolium]